MTSRMAQRGGSMHRLRKAARQRARGMTDLMGVDVAELDVLRDRTSGRIYVIDVNVTAAGPSVFLRLPARLRLYLQSIEAWEAHVRRYDTLGEAEERPQISPESDALVLARDSK